jgi:beta-lactamase superfamily II metal-dependent hydrolase
MKLTFNRVSILFSGDILQEKEQQLIARRAPLAAAVIKAPHHGGLNTSSEEFIKCVSPEVAVFSCRSYGTLTLPAPEVLAEYQRAGAKIFQTDKHGAIQVETDGRSYRVVTNKEMK